jgi:hypothetical protein
MARKLGVAGLLVLIGAVSVAALPLVASEGRSPLAELGRLPERLWTRMFPPTVAPASRLADLTGPEREAVAALAPRLDGLVTWSSNRSGNHELYLLDLRARTVRRLTRHPHVDFFGRFSPDGRRLVFLRSQREWVSFRDPTAWDVYLIGVDGTGERRLAQGGYSPTWAPDGRAVVFLRGTRVVRLDLDTGRETLVLDAAVTEGIQGPVENPELSPDGRRLAVTARSARYDGVAVVDLPGGSLHRLSPGQACQLTWTPAGGLVWVEPGGRGGTQLMTAPSPAGPRQGLIDLPGPYSHEYFPRLANDGRWLIWGAAAEGHEHDRADYELFVWQPGTPADQAVRLTYHPGNDQWPDLHVRHP